MRPPLFLACEIQIVRKSNFIIIILNLAPPKSLPIWCSVTHLPPALTPSPFATPLIPERTRKQTDKYILNNNTADSHALRQSFKQAATHPQRQTHRQTQKHTYRLTRTIN